MSLNIDYNVPRSIRVFISSTFCDMQNERNHLVNKVFPKIRRVAEKRGVNFVVIDLRWGITKEKDGQSGKVVYSCLKEIENSRPFFIGLLGDRYGWCPKADNLQKNEDFNREYSWILNDIRHKLSITEIEMQYGVLRSKTPINASFYIKKNCQEPHVSFFSKIFGNLSDEQKLARLKRKIRAQHTYPYFEYKSIEELGAQVEHSLMELLNKLFPDKELNYLEKERLEQYTFIRTKTSVYVKDMGALHAISDFVSHPLQQLLCISGQSGLGKSALLANWVVENGNNISRPIICHFIANTEDGGSARQVLMHLIEELCDCYGLSYASPQQGQQINEKKVFIELLAKDAVQSNPPILIVDAVDQLHNDEKSLWWLPSKIGKEKWILSAADGDFATEALIDYAKSFTEKTQFYKLEPLPDEQRRQLIVTYLGRHGKQLEDLQLQRIMEFSLSTNTLVLKSLLDELMVFGVYEKLNERIDYYTNAVTIDSFFQRMIHRYEQDFGKQLVQKSLTLLALSRYGISENTLMQIGDIRPIDWSSFFCSFYTHLVSKNGYISFSHRSILNAVNNIYMVDHISVIALRKELAKYLREQARQRGCYLDSDYEEIPYQLSASNSWDDLYEFLLDVHVLRYFNYKTFDSWNTFWRSLYEKDSKKYTITRFINVFKQAGLSDDVIDTLSLDLERTALDFLSSEDAMILAENSIGLNSSNSLWSVPFHRFYIVDHLEASNQLQRALSELNKVKEFMESHPDFPLIDKFYRSPYLMRLAAVYYKLKNYDAAKNILLDAIQLDSGKGILPLSSSKFILLGRVCIEDGSFEDAEKYLKHAMTLIGKDDLQKRTTSGLDCLLLLGKMFTGKGELKEALNYYLEGLKLAEQILSPNDPIIKRIYENMADIYEKEGNEQERKKTLVMAMDNEAYHIIDKYIQMYNNAFATMQRGEHEYAIKLYRDFLTTIEPQKKAFESYIYKAYANIASCYHNLGDIDTAIVYYETAKPQIDKLKGKELDRMALFYFNYGSALYKKYRDREVVEMMRCFINIKSQPEAYDMPEELRSARLLLERSLFACGETSLKNQEYSQAVIYYEEAIEINKTYINDKELALRFNQAGIAYGYLGNYTKALDYHINALEERKKHGVSADDKNLASIYQNIGYDYQFLGNANKAKEFLEYSDYLNNKNKTFL